MATPGWDDQVARIRAALDAGRKIEAIRLYREATGTSLAAAKEFVDALEAGARIAQDSAPPSQPTRNLADFGWIAEPVDGGGVCLRRSAGGEG